MQQIMVYEEIHKLTMSRDGELLGVDDKIYALNNQLVIFLLRILTWRCGLAHKVVWGRHQL